MNATRQLTIRLHQAADCAALAAHEESDRMEAVRLDALARVLRAEARVAGQKEKVPA